MISRQRILDIAMGLEQKTAKGEVAWIKENNGVSAPSEFYVKFPKSTFSVRHHSPFPEPDYIDFEICDERG